MQPTLTGTLLRERRQAAGLRQADLARAAGISAAYLNLLEHNRRNVTPAVLARLAGALDLPADALGGGTAAALADELRAAAARVPGAGAELARAEDFLARYPGWAALVQRLAARVGVLEPTLAALNDRLAQDPHLSAALHEVLSALSGVRSAAQILAETPDLSPDWRARFLGNLQGDSARMAEGAKALVAYLDRSDAAVDAPASAQDEVETWLSARDWQIGAGAEGLSPAAAALAGALALDAARDAAVLPDARLRAALEKAEGDPVAAAQGLADVPPVALIRRLALFPGSPAGLVLCDGSGTMVFRKPCAGFALPRFGAPCPLWPLYDALARPGAFLHLRVETAGTLQATFRTLAACETRHPLGFAGPELRLAAMLVLPDPGGKGPSRALGSTCRVCPRGGCPARREAALLG